MPDGAHRKTGRDSRPVLFTRIMSQGHACMQPVSIVTAAAVVIIGERWENPGFSALGISVICTGTFRWQILLTATSFFPSFLSSFFPALFPSFLPSFFSSSFAAGITATGILIASAEILIAATGILITVA